jgi:putative transposase
VGDLQQELAMSERRACRTIGCARSSCRRQGVGKPQDEGLERLRALAQERPRYGYRRLHVLLQREGIVMNHKRLWRLYRQEGLAVRPKRRKRAALGRRVMLPAVQRVNERWSMDFVGDSLADGRTFRALNIVDDFTREAPAIVVDQSLPGARVVRELEALVTARGVPQMIVTDNGPEFAGKALDAWAYRRGVKLHFIRPGKPVENAYIESFNGKFRDECLPCPPAQASLAPTQHAGGAASGPVHPCTQASGHDQLARQSHAGWKLLASAAYSTTGLYAKMLVASKPAPDCLQTTPHNSVRSTLC